jgi:hypothetical protein
MVVFLMEPVLQGTLFAIALLVISVKAVTPLNLNLF